VSRLAVESCCPATIYIYRIERHHQLRFDPCPRLGLRTVDIPLETPLGDLRTTMPESCTNTISVSTNPNTRSLCITCFHRSPRRLNSFGLITPTSTAITRSLVSRPRLGCRISVGTRTFNRWNKLYESQAHARSDIQAHGSRSINELRRKETCQSRSK